jgi:hypothetical protein
MVDLNKARDAAYVLRTGAGGSHPAADLIEGLCGEVDRLTKQLADLSPLVPLLGEMVAALDDMHQANRRMHDTQRLFLLMMERLLKSTEAQDCSDG